MTRLDWDKVGREERVRRHGSVSVYHGLPRRNASTTKPWKTKSGKAYAEKLRPRLNAVLDELKGVPPANLEAAQDRAVKHLNAIASAERARLTGPRQKIRLAVLEREIRKAFGRARGTPKKTSKPKPKPAPLSRSPRSNRPKFQLGPLPSSVRTSQRVGGETRQRVRGTLDELGLRLYWDADERVDHWLLAIRRNGKVVRRETVRRCEWTGKVGSLAGTHALEVRLTGMAGDRMVSWSGAGLTITGPEPARKRRRNDGRRRGRSG